MDTFLILKPTCPTGLTLGLCFKFQTISSFLLKLITPFLASLGFLSIMNPRSAGRPPGYVIEPPEKLGNIPMFKLHPRPLKSMGWDAGTGTRVGDFYWASKVKNYPPVSWTACCAPSTAHFSVPNPPFPSAAVFLGQTDNCADLFSVSSCPWMWSAWISNPLRATSTY